jgi:formylglycine-generating enzyme required for sulfatase activity
MPHIFISYSKKDTKSLALDLANQFNALEGVTAWVDVEGIDYGDEWETLIQRQIIRCDYMVVLYSPDINRHIDDESQTESYVLKEIRYAQIRKKPILPVMAQYTDPPMSLISIQYIEYEKEGITSDELVKRLCKRMKIIPTPKAGAVSVASSKPQIATPLKPKIILPQPFDWCYIPAGKVTLTPDAIDNNIYIKQNTILNVPAFWIAKYPITNAQYREFILDKGYPSDNYWTQSGINARNKNGWTKPRYWGNSKWNQLDYPVIGISWYEAIAFCNWLSRKIDNNIILPSDSMWQHAAQGDDNRQYPWGNLWNPSFCNNNVNDNDMKKVTPSHRNETTPVYMYEGKGNSPFGVVDMAGNTWDICSSQYRDINSIDGDSSIIIRGGSWNHLQQNKFKTTYREELIVNWDNHRNEFIGFRIACQIDSI